MTKSIIHALLPHKEKFTHQNAGAVAMVLADMIKFSASNALVGDTSVFGIHLDHPPIAEDYTPLMPRQAFLFGKNIGLARGYLHHLKTLNIRPDWVEVHGRCHVAHYIAKARPDLKIVLVLHNDPRQMKGAKSAAERRQLAKILTGVFAVSHFLMDCFNDGLTPCQQSEVIQHIIPHGIDTFSAGIPKKQKCINVTGRMVAEKGMVEIAEALAKTLPHHPEWTVEMIGARHFSASGGGSDYENQVAAALKPLGAQAKLLGFMPLDALRQHQMKSAIAVVPSIWQEPAGRVVLEAMAAGCALVTTRRGGIPEYAEGRALIIDDPNADSFADALSQLLSNDAEIKKYQQMGRKNYPFTNAAAADALLRARHKIHLKIHDSRA